MPETKRKQKLTDRRVILAEARARPYIIWDDHPSVAGFGIKVTPAGKKAFKYTYRNAQGRQRWLHLGYFPRLSVADARQQAKIYQGEVAKGQDPHAAKMEERRRPSDKTFGQLAADYFAQPAPEHRSLAQYEGHYNRHLKYLAKREAGELTTAEFVRLKNKLLKEGKRGLVGPVLAVASAIYRWGIEEQVFQGTNPVHGVKQPKQAKKAAGVGREYSADEIRSLWNAFTDLDTPWGAIFKLMLVTGQRGDEVRHMRWEDIHEGTWVQPTNKRDRVHTVPLSQTALDILESLGVQPSGLIFANANGEAWAKVPTDIFKLVRKATGIADFRAHNLRHTAATEMSRAGVPDRHVSKVLNHAEAGTTPRYQHYAFDREKRAALLRWESALQAILEDEKGNVINFPT